jgi:hypothetical protein
MDRMKGTQELAKNMMNTRLVGSSSSHDHADAVVRVLPTQAEDYVWFEDRWMVASLCDE